MKRVLDAVDACVAGIVAALFVTALALSILGVAGRYVSSGLQLDWIGEVVIFLVIWAVLLGAARVARRGSHIRVDFLFDKLPARGRLAADLMSLGLALALGAFLVWSGWLVVEEAHRWDERSISTMRVPLWIYYAALPVSFVLQFLFTLERIGAVLTGRDTAPTHDLAD